MSYTVDFSWTLCNVILASDNKLDSIWDGFTMKYSARALAMADERIALGPLIIIYLLLGAITASCVMYAAICLLLMLLFATAFDGKKTRGVWRVSCVMLMLTCFFMVGSRN